VRVARRRGHSARDGVGNVVVLQIEKHAIAARHQFVDKRRTDAREQLLADLEAADSASQAIGECVGIGCRIDVKRDQ